jgi:hypothetical protein
LQNKFIVAWKMAGQFCPAIFLLTKIEVSLLPVACFEASQPEADRDEGDAVELKFLPAEKTESAAVMIGR